MGLFDKKQDTTPVINDGQSWNNVTDAQLQEDLSMLQVAEKRNTEKYDIAKNIENYAERIAKSALSINNPFRGV